jgi:hypothetical protein
VEDGRPARLRPPYTLTGGDESAMNCASGPPFSLPQNAGREVVPAPRPVNGGAGKVKNPPPVTWHLIPRLAPVHTGQGARAKG